MERKRTGILLAAVVAAAIMVAGGCDKLRARDQLNKGVEAFGAGQFEQAIEHFKQAQQYDPSLTNAELYLAAAYAQQYTPGAPSEENLRNGQEAIRINQDILSKDPNNLLAIDNLGSLLFNMAKTPFDEQGMNNAKQYHEKHIQLAPNDPEPYYWVGVIDWSVAYRNNNDMRQEYNASAKKPIHQDDPLPAALQKPLIDKNTEMVNDGITNLNKAIELKPDYDDAMSYLNLMYRQKADLETTPAARDSDLKMAEDLTEKSKAIKQKKEASSQTSSS